MSDPRTRIAALLLAAVSALFIWWGWKQGAYFGSVFYPGAVLIFSLLALMLVFVAFSGRISGPAKIALVALFGLAVWTLLSVLWSPTPAAALKDAGNVFLYAALFVLGIWATNLLGRRMLFAMAPVAIAGTVVGVATIFVLATGTDVAWYLHDDATLRFPIGYRNANAAFFLICLWPLLAMVTFRAWPWELRALLIPAGTVLVELSFLAQSRGSVPAVVFAVLVYLALSRDRLRATALIALVLLPALPALPTLLDVYGHGQADPAVVPLLRDAAKAIVVTTVFSFVVAVLALGVVAPRLRLSKRSTSLIGRTLATTAVLTIAVGGTLFIARHGGPIGFADQRVKEFTRVGYPDLRGQGIRYGFNVGSHRHDFWRVGIDEGLDRPLLGGGAGSFEVAYLQERRADATPEDPHNVEVLMFSELGLPGLLLFAAFIVAVVGGAMRSRRLGPAAAALVAGSLAAATQWLIQASFDWLWNYPGITAPAIYLLGVAVAPTLFDLSAGRGRRVRGVATAGLLALALMTIPLYLSSRYVQRANEVAQVDPHAAIADLDRASDLDPLKAEPLLLKGTIESRLGEPELALAAFHQALDREPRNYTAYYLIARELVYSNPQAARRALLRARELNPSDPGVAALERLLEDDSSQAPEP